MMQLNRKFYKFMKQIKQNQVVPPLKKSTTMQRDFYVCFCAKNYNSYSALYLHAKKKHGQNLSMKCQKHIRHEWSGNVKNIYHQFVQEQDMDIENQSQREQSFREIKNTIKKRKDSSSSSKSRKFKNGNLKSIKNGQSPKSSSQASLNEQKIKQIFHRYLQQRNNGRKMQDRVYLIEDFQQHVLKVFNESNNKQASSQLQDKGSLQFIPNTMNQFFISYPKKNSENQHHIISQLMMLSDWFYTQNYCRSLAISSDCYQKFANSTMH